MSKPDILPLCTTREMRGEIAGPNGPEVPCYCMGCHKQFGYRNKPGPGTGYVGYLCVPCAESLGPQVGLMIVPDRVHADRCRAEMLATYGRELTEPEMARVLDDPTTALAKLARER